MTTRGFEIVSKYAGKGVRLPVRATAGSAGYDIAAATTVTLQPGEIGLVPTGLKAYMQPGEVLQLYDRSSNPRKLGVTLANSVGVIDQDYYNNADNEGEIFAQLMNITDHAVAIATGTRVVQGVFVNFLTADGDEAAGARTGGFGSTGK